MIVSVSACRAPNSSSCASTASATCDGVRVGRLGDGQGQRRLAVRPGDSRSSRPCRLDRAEVAERDRRRGDGRGGAADGDPSRSARRAGRDRRRGRAHPDDEVARCASTEASSPSSRPGSSRRHPTADRTGASGCSPGGRRWICCDRDAGLGELGRVERDEQLVLEAAGHVGAGDALDGGDRRDDLGPGDARRPRRGRPRRGRDRAMITGEALMLSAETLRLDVAGRPALREVSSMVVGVALTSVPNENWATTSATELAEVDWSGLEARARRRWRARSAWRPARRHPRRRRPGTARRR